MFVIYKDRQNYYRWTFRAANNRTIADSGEGYSSKANCQYGISLVVGLTSLSQFTFYVDVSGQHRWRVSATNNRIIADSGESYHNRADCEAGARLLLNANSGTPVHDNAA